MQIENNYFKVDLADKSSSIHQKRLGSVAIPESDDHAFLLIKHKRQGNTISWEFPRGFGLKEESDKETAKRELHEETNLIAYDAHLLGYVRPDNGFLDSKASLYICNIHEFKNIILQKDEGILNYKIVDYFKLAQMVQNGGITDGYTLAAYAYITVPTNNYIKQLDNTFRIDAIADLL